MSLTTQLPTETQLTKGAFSGETELTHPAYGLISVARWTTSSDNDERMFGTEMNHRSGITITLSQAANRRALNKDWIHETNTVAEWSMSESQWARFVASVGLASGVPVTLQRYNTSNLESVPGIAVPVLTKKERHGAEIERSAADAVSKLQAELTRLAQMIEDGKANKKELRSVHHNLSCSLDNLPKDLRYAMDTFNRGMEKTIDDAKTEIEAHIAGTATRLGLDQMRQSMPSLEGGPVAGPLVIEGNVS